MQTARRTTAPTVSAISRAIYLISSSNRCLERLTPRQPPTVDQHQIIGVVLCVGGQTPGGIGLALIFWLHLLYQDKRWKREVRRIFYNYILYFHIEFKDWLFWRRTAFLFLSLDFCYCSTIFKVLHLIIFLQM